MHWYSRIQERDELRQNKDLELSEKHIVHSINWL